MDFTLSKYFIKGVRNGEVVPGKKTETRQA